MVARTKFLNARSGLAVLAVLALALTACSGSPASSPDDSTDPATAEAAEVTEVSVRTDVYFSGAVLPLVAGVELGIYEDHGLEITINPGTGSATTIQTVGNGSDDIGYADAAALVQSVAKGIPVKMVYGMVQQSPLALFAFDDSGITTPTDLEGKTAGYTAGSAAEVLFPAFAKAVGIDEEAVTFRNVDIPTRTNLFMAEKTDFTFGLLNVSEPNIEILCDCSIVSFPYYDAGVQTLSSGIIAGDSFIKDNPDVLKRFLAATQEAVEFANENTDEAVDAFFKVATDSTAKKSVIAAQWKASWELRETALNEGQPFGCTAASDWESTIDLMEQYAEMKPDSVVPGAVADNSFNPGSCSEPLGDS
jgi:NitT/TauT family transport system substrate-binding protein